MHFDICIFIRTIWCLVNMYLICIDFFSAHPFIKKEWYRVQVPSNFDISNPTLTPCNKTAGQSKYFVFGFSCTLAATTPFSGAFKY